MVAKTVGNHGAFITGRVGVGRENYPNTSLGWVTIVGKSGDVKYVSVVGLNRAQTNLGYFVQCGPNVTATLEFTLANDALALDPVANEQGMVPWSNSLNVDSTIKKIVDSNNTPLAFNAIKITFGASGEVYLGSR